MGTSTTNPSNVLVLTTSQNGYTVIPSGTPLARLNYFDGKFLRAEDLRSEQLYLRNLVRLSNKSGGHGVADGFSVTRGSGDQLKVSPGLAVNADGQVILLTGTVTVSLLELINQTRQVISVQRGVTTGGEFGDCVEAVAAPPSRVLEIGDLFVITVAPAEAWCGQEDVYGKLCEDACVTSTDRPFVLEGIVLRARPLVLNKPLPVSSAFPFDETHLRSRVASAVFAQEPALIGSLISKAGLESHVWCLGAQADGGAEVPLAVVDRSGAAIGFLDAWTVRREKIDTVAKRYWQWRMAMRPWDVYLAQILQFQCQLADLLQNGPQGTGGDPCSPAKDLVKQASAHFDEVTQYYGRVASKLAALNVEGLPGGLGLLSSFQAKLSDFTKLIQLPPQDRRLLRGGIVETPSAAYLPVAPGDALTVNAQVRQWMGEGVDLRFCIVRPDFVPHALEEAQHMERISLTQGLDNPQAKPQVDVLVPNGEIIKQPTASSGQGYEAVVQLFPALNQEQPRLMTISVAPAASLNLQGAATTHALPTGGGAFYLAGASTAPKGTVIRGLMDTLTELGSSHLTNLAHLSTAANRQPVPSGNIGNNPALFSRLTLNAAAAARNAAAMRAGTEAVAPTPVAQQVAAIWMQLSCSGNPFTLSLGDSTPLSLRVTTVLPGNPAEVKDYRLQGDLIITQAASGGTSKTLRGLFSGTYVIDNQSTPIGGPLRFEVDATYDAGGSVVDVKLTGVNSTKLTVQFEIKTIWEGSPEKVGSRVVYRIVRGETLVQEVTMLASSLTRNDQVLEAGQSSHTAALSALDVVGAALKDSAFSDAAARLLFPPPPPPSSDLLVRATLDWVLFHRRRTKTCATETVNVIASARRYQVFHLRAPDTEFAAEVIKALLNNDSALLQKAGFKQVDVVEFAAGSPALNTPQSAIQADWSIASPPPSQVHYAAIVSQGAATADGSGLALQRLGRFQDAILPISPPAAQAKYETLPLFPSVLPAPGLDGDIVVITIPTPKFTGHRVLRTALALQDVVERIKKSGVTKVVANQEVLDLGLVQFLEHTANPKSDDLDGIQTKWNAAGGEPVTGVAVVFDPADTSDTAATRAAQSVAISKEIGVDKVPQPFPITVVAEPLTTSVTILQFKIEQPIPVVNRSARLLIWRPDATGAGRTILPLPSPIALEFKPDNTLVKRLTATQVKALQKFGVTVRLMEFFTREAIPDAQTADRAKLLGKELDSQGFKPTIVPQIGTLPANLSALVPADAATSQDIVFIEVLG